MTNKAMSDVLKTVGDMPLTDLEKLFLFMGELNKAPDDPVTNAQLIHTIHLVIGTIQEQAEAIGETMVASIEESLGS